MADFFIVATRSPKRGIVEVYPKFIVKESADLMIRGGDFYAVWIEERGIWSMKEQDALKMIDAELDIFAKKTKSETEDTVKVLHLWDAESGMIDRWHKYCQSQMKDHYHTLDETLIFSNDTVKKTDYASKRLPYALAQGELSAYNRLMGVLYSDEERRKIEWAIGAVVDGASKDIQKFLVLYGGPGTGKSTVLDIIKKLFDGYCARFEAKSLGMGSNAFALEAFRSNPLVAMDPEGNLSRIDDNTRLNSLVAHETMLVNEKFKSAYPAKFKTFLFIASNDPVKITNAKSGLIRRLIDVSPTGDKVPKKEYDALKKQVGFELGAIAWHCREVYLSDPGYYDDYIPLAMMGATNDFYNFVADSYPVFRKNDGVSAAAAWEMYKTYCDEARVPHPLSQKAFREELKNYFRECRTDRTMLADGSRPRMYYSGFHSEKFEDRVLGAPEERKEKEASWLSFTETESIFDRECAGCPAQYASAEGTPMKKWERVKTTLSALDTRKLHYVCVPWHHIVIDFDIPDENGQKSYEKNLAAAQKWPPTYAELSKSGAGIHLHYIYTGNPELLSRVYEEHIEVKVFNGNSSLRRMLTKCNALPIASIGSGLPLKGEKVINFDGQLREKGIRTLILRNLNKEIHPGTKPSVDFIYKILEDAYNSDLHYDVTDMRNAALAFAAGSTHQADYCIKLVNKMRFKSDDSSENTRNDEAKLVFYDVEVFPNLFLVNWKMEGEGKQVVRMINPSPEEIENLMRFRLVGFNCRRYDNHILYARLMGYDNAQLYHLSQKIVGGSANCFFGEAYNVSYTDIYDFASAGNKKSLKKLEIEMGIHHQELGLPWDQPVPKEKWTMVAEYCDNDVLATEAAFHYLNGDWTARQILADLAGMTVNDTTNSLTTRIIFGNNRKPQDGFNYRFIGCDELPWTDTEQYTLFDEKGRPQFPGYTFENGKSTYRGEEVGEGGYVYAEPGMYGDAALLDIASMHPSSIVAEELFGPVYTKRFKDILDARIAIKHEDWEKAETMLDGKLRPYIQKVKNGELTSKQLANALKTAINSVYGLTSAGFKNPFRDERNKDNIVAKRGALFMINLKHEVQKKGFTVAHIKTDSIKIPDATPEIIDFVMEYGKRYGYTFEHEDTYDRMCLVNDAVYIARYKTPHKDKKTGTDIWWTATGAQFQVPYVFKTLFSKEALSFDDMCETKSVSTALYLDMNEGLPDVSEQEKHLEKARKDPEVAQMDEVNRKEYLWELENEVEIGHNYIFVGRVGQFCPIKKGCGGGLLMRETVNRQTGEKGYAAATGSKGYRWMESEMVRELGKEADIDRRYYDAMVDAAVEDISKYGDFEWFVSEDPYVSNTAPWQHTDGPWDGENGTPFDVR